MEDKKKVDRALQLISKLSIDKASQVLSKMIKGGASIAFEKAYMADITDATQKVNEEFEEIVGSFIRLVGDAPFKFLFFVSPADSYVLTDMILRREPGTTKEFNAYASSAVQEIGNILASAITNVFSADFGIMLYPSPPTVMHDFAGTVFSEYILEAAIDRNEVLIIQSKFSVVKQNVGCHMFLLPVHDADKTLSQIASNL